MTITVDDMRAKLLTLDDARERLATTEPFESYQFTVSNAVRFHINPGWQHGIAAKSDFDQVDATIQLGVGKGSVTIPLTKAAVIEAASRCGLNKVYTPQLPAKLLEDQLNYWFRGGFDTKPKTKLFKGRDLQLLVIQGSGVAVVPSTHLPYSNLRMLDAVLEGITARYGNHEILVDYKFSHTPSLTRLRLIVPERTRRIAGTDIADDPWSVGVQMTTSLLAEQGAKIEGYLFRWWCTNGAVDTRATAGAYSRAGNVESRAAKTEAGYDWARAGVAGVLAELESSLDRVQQMVNVPVEGDVTDVLRDVFEHYRVSANDRPRIIENIVNAGGSLTMYSIMQAITQVANRSDLTATESERLMRLGGDLPHAETSRCDACRRLIKH